MIHFGCLHCCIDKVPLGKLSTGAFLRRFPNIYFLNFTITCLFFNVQAGSDEVLERMKRGYTRAAYLDLVHHIR